MVRPSARLLSPTLAVAGLASVLVPLVVAAASLVGQATFPLLAGIPAAQVQGAIVATALAVGFPVILGLAVAIVRLGEGKRDLASREALLNAAQHHARIGYWEYDLASGLFVLPDLVHHILGDPGRTLRITVPVLMDMAHPEDREAISAALARIVGQGTQEHLEYRLTAADGTEKTFWATGTRLLGRDGRPSKVFGLFNDITERKATEAALRESEDHYRHAVELNPGILWVTDAQGHTIEMSSRFDEVTGLPREDSLGTRWLKVLHPDDMKIVSGNWRRSVASGEPFDMEYRVRLAEGDYHWFRDRGYPRRDATGRVVRWYGTIEDIHDRKVADLALRASEAFASSILESSADCMRVVSLDGRLEYMNGPGVRALEFDERGAPIGAPWRELWPEEARPRIDEALAAARRGGIDRFTGFCPTAKGTAKWWDVSVSPILGPDGAPARLLATSRDITAQKLAQDELRHLAHHDSLTGLPNRKRFMEGVEAALRGGPSGGLALLLIDLDEFKAVNDALGHPAGDRLLREAAGRLQACLRGSDLVARLGGDEFAVLGAGLRDEEEARTLAERIMARLSQPYMLEEREVAVGASIGIEHVKDGCQGADDLLKKADIALYRAKSDGRGTCRFFEPGMDREAEARQSLASELRGALARGEFELHYQPIVRLDVRRVSAFEALLRWRHPERGLIAPGEFIALLEQTGAIVEVGAWVLAEACRAAAGWPGDTAVSVNLSPRQFRDGGLVEAVLRALRASGLPAGRLRFEITESLLLQHSDAVCQALQRLRAAGVHLSIDDFGVGYSSLGYLRTFSVDSIKIDRSFVGDLLDNARTRAILRAVIGLGRDLGVSITAEGVESAEQMDRLLAMGCREGQGYLFGRPMPAGELPAFLERVQSQAWMQDPRQPPAVDEAAGRLYRH